MVEFTAGSPSPSGPPGLLLLERPDSRSWEKLLGSTHAKYRITDVSGVGPDADFSAWVRTRSIGSVNIVDCACDPHAGVRSEVEVSADTTGWGALLFVLGGTEHVRAQNHERTLTAGSNCLYFGDQASSYRVTERLRKRTIFIPDEFLLDGVPGLRRRGDVRLDTESTSTRLLMSMLDEAVRGPDLVGADSRLVEKVLMDLVFACLRPEKSHGVFNSSRALLPRLKDLIEEHLGNPELSPTFLAAQAHVSLRTLHAAFADAGVTAGTYIRDRRLAEARRDLMALRELSLTTIAHKWGFWDLSHFSRSFKARYGVPPRDLRSDPGID